MNWKYIKNIDKKKDFAEMFIYDEIADDKVNGANFAIEMRYLIQYEGVGTVKIKINSVGGNVLHCQTIVSEMIDAQEKGVIIETYGQGLMASSAAIIFLTAKKENRYCKDFGRLMVHGVSPSEQKNLTENDLVALENFKKVLVQILSNRTGKKEKFFEELFTNGKDNWFTVNEMVKLGFLLAENVEKTGVKIDITEQETTAGVVVVYNKLLTAQNELIINKNEVKMKTVIARLNLQEAADEAAVETAVIAIQNKLQTTETTLTETQNKLLKAEEDLAAANTALAAQNKTAAAEFVAQLKKDGKIAAEKEAEVLIEAENNLEGVKKLFGAMPAKAANVLTMIGKDDILEANDAYKGKTFRELEKAAPDYLNSLKVSNKAEYVKLYNEQYKTTKTEADLCN